MIHQESDHITGQGLTALHYAVEGSHIDSIKVLLYWGAEPLMTDLSIKRATTLQSPLITAN
jgi:hypothetical protein